MARAAAAEARAAEMKEKEEAKKIAWQAASDQEQQDYRDEQGPPALICSYCGRDGRYTGLSSTETDSENKKKPLNIGLDEARLLHPVKTAFT